MKNIIALGGSNSRNSINKLLATYVANKVKNATASVLDLNDFQLPLYGVDLETENGIPQNAKKLNELIVSTDGLVISLAEHNGSYTSSFKNTIDWLSRIDVKVWKDKPILLLSTSPGARGGATVLQSAKAYFPYLGGDVVADFSLASFYENFSENKISNRELEEELDRKIQLFEQKINSSLI